MMKPEQVLRQIREEIENDPTLPINDASDTEQVLEAIKDKIKEEYGIKLNVFATDDSVAPSYALLKSLAITHWGILRFL